MFFRLRTAHAADPRNGSLTLSGSWLEPSLIGFSGFMWGISLVGRMWGFALVSTLPK
jgi:hypothetical protein